MSEYFIQIITVLLSHKTKRAHSTVHYIYFFNDAVLQCRDRVCVCIFME